jgi:Flp pilus assembly protein TadG
MNLNSHAIGARERGAALVEFTLVLPLLVLLLFAILDFGRAINYWIDETHLANAAARWAAVDHNPGPGSTIAGSVQQQADTAELRDGGTSAVPNPVSVSISCPDGPTLGNPVVADVTVDYNWLPFIGDEIGVASTTLSASATMRLEANSTEC